MARKHHTRRNTRGSKRVTLPHRVSLILLLLIIAMSGVHLVWANVEDHSGTIYAQVDPNFGIKNKVSEFFEANDALEMIPIIKCESHFKHYNKDGSVLTNKRGSSATGVAQILASQHPDPKIIYRYNKRYNMDLTVDDFDITTLEGNIGYALVLYKVNGVKDWECSKRFRF